MIDVNKIFFVYRDEAMPLTKLSSNHLRDAAWVTGTMQNICRYNGQVQTTLDEHSARVASIVNWAGGNIETSSAALVHDLHEVFVGDTISTIKNQLPGLGYLEEYVDARIRRAFPNIDWLNVDYDLLAAADHDVRWVELAKGGVEIFPEGYGAKLKLTKYGPAGITALLKCAQTPGGEFADNFESEFAALCRQAEMDLVKI